MNDKKFWGAPKNILVLAVLAVFVGHRGGLEWLTRVFEPVSVVTPSAPTVDLSTLTPALRGLYQPLLALSNADREILAQFYAGLSRAVAGDPPSEPVMPTTADLRKAHRGGLLFLWVGMAANAPNKYDGLSSALSGVLTEAVGDGDVPMNPAIRQSASDAFIKVALLCQSVRR
jgi:hypothetical protein